MVVARLAAVACAEMPSHSRGPGNIRVRVWVSFTTGAVRSAILATASNYSRTSHPSQQNSMYRTCFVDYQKAFDRINHEKLLNSMEKAGIPDLKRRLIRSLLLEPICSH